MGGRRPVRGRRRRAPRRDIRHLRPAPQRHRRPAHGSRTQWLDPRRAHPLAPDARLRHALAARLRPCGHRDAERRRESAREGGSLASGDRARGVRRADVGVAREDRPHDHGPVPTARLVARLLARALHDGRRLRPGRDDVLRPALGARLDLSRESHRQLVPVPSDGDLRPRGRARGDGRHAVHDPLPVRGRRRTRRRLHRDRPAGHDPRRRRGRRASRKIRAIEMRSAARWSFRTSSIAFL